MKILFLSAANNVHTVKWVNALSNRNLEVYLVYQKNHCPAENKIDQKVRCIQLPYGGNKGYFLNSISLWKIFRRIKPDIVNAHYASGYGTLARMARVKPLILSVWGSDVYDFPLEGLLKKAILIKNLKYANEIASTSNIMADVTKKILGKPVNIAVTPFGVDTNKFKPLNNSHKDDKFIIGNIKTLSAKYGIEYLIQAVSTLINELKDENYGELADKIRLYIYGDGPQKEEYISLTESLGISLITKFLGKIPNDQVPNALSEIDIFCCSSSSNSESFGVAVVEAMACGVPVVATDVDGFKEVMKNGETGFIVKRNDVGQLVYYLKKLLLNDDMRKEMGMNGVMRVKSLYEWYDNVTLMESIYKKVILTHKRA